jgi:hypothetical protein
MATQDYAASIQGVSIRVTRLDANGNLLNGAGDSYTTSAFMRISFTPEYEEGDEITEKSASGESALATSLPIRSSASQWNSQFVSQTQN